LRQAGTTILRFPGGSTADTYHWQTNSITPGQSGYADPKNTFDAFMGVVQKTGAQAMITVNYGSNAAGTGGGDPNEAAAWVQYANITKHYGIQYWEIGNELYGNGTYGSHWETDLHTQLGPAAYANNALTFIQAMKAVDPTIKIGVVLTAPGNWPDGVSPDWNSTVLSILGSKIDFVDVHWYPQNPGNESDTSLLSSTSKIPGMVATLRSLIKQYAGTQANKVQIAITETNSVAYNPGKQTVGLVDALFLDDNYMNWLENGVANVDWWAVHNGIVIGQNNSSSLYGTANYGDYGVLSNGKPEKGVKEPPLDTPFPSYFALQMLSKLGAAGDTMVEASSNQSLIAAHAVMQRDGKLAILLINKDPSNSYSVSFSLPGYTPGGHTTVYSYGINSTAISASSDPSFASTLTETIPPYSLTTIVLTPQG